jgi:hypothetical protein
MECCVCYKDLIPEHAVSFERNLRCRSSHALCVPCYTTVHGCPICRFTPYNKPDTDGDYLLEHLRNQKKRDFPRINYIKDMINQKNM